MLHGCIRLFSKATIIDQLKQVCSVQIMIKLRHQLIVASLKHNQQNTKCDMSKSTVIAVAPC